MAKTVGDLEIRAAMTITGDPPPILWLPEAATQTFVKGELVYLAAGYVTEIGGDTPSVIYGVAAANGSNKGSNGAVEVPVFLATPVVLFEANVKTSALANHVLVAANLGTPMGIQRDVTKSKTFLNQAVTAGADIRTFTHKVARDSVLGDTNARVLFTFLPNWIQFEGTS